MRDDHTREQEEHDRRVQGLKALVGGMTTIEEGRGAIKMMTAQIKKRTAQRPATKVSMIGAADNGAGSRRWIRGGRNNQP